MLFVTTVFNESLYQSLFIEDNVQKCVDNFINGEDKIDPIIQSAIKVPMSL